MHLAIPLTKLCNMYNYLQKDKQRDQPDHSCRRRHCHWNVTSLFIHLVTSCRDRTPRQLKPL